MIGNRFTGFAGNERSDPNDPNEWAIDLKLKLLQKPEMNQR